MDVWEPSIEDGDDIMIHHTGSITSKITLTSVLVVINELAFERTRFYFLLLKFNFKVSTFYSFGKPFVYRMATKILCFNKNLFGYAFI